MKPLVIGHRGASGELPENTMAAFKRAFDEGADGVELDVHLSKDGVPVVIHDETLARTTNSTGLVRSKTLKELRELDAGKGEKIPTLEEVLKLVVSKKKLVLIELKADGSPAPVVDVICKLKARERVIVPSFHKHLVREMKKIEPEIETGLIVATPIDYVATLNDLKAENAMLLSILANKSVVEKLHAAGKKVFVWTINKQPDAKKAKSIGVDGIVTNFPAMARAALKS
ncbi:MAG TPA: glycerophosphodiester phosphodiesterase family protein [Candidatus Norongarragalinales archaeon]|jgi:glycerophosphoryl diester phosphodiesterase|nr:glycerophosphodiester phosphodiesterase family protein [Candidatus Norongarragalinales archaeon]